MTYLLVLLLPAVFFGIVGLVVREAHAVERRRTFSSLTSTPQSVRQTA